MFQSSVECFGNKTVLIKHVLVLALSPIHFLEGNCLVNVSFGVTCGGRTSQQPFGLSSISVYISGQVKAGRYEGGEDGKRSIFSPSLPFPCLSDSQVF